MSSHRPTYKEIMLQNSAKKVSLKPEPSGNLVEYRAGFETGIVIGIESVIILFVANRISKNLSPSLSPKTLATIVVSCGLSGLGLALAVNKGWASLPRI